MLYVKADLTDPSGVISGSAAKAAECVPKAQ